MAEYESLKHITKAGRRRIHIISLTYDSCTLFINAVIIHHTAAINESALKRHEM